jgi:fructose transport system permease protein
MVLSSVVMGQFTFRYGLPPDRRAARPRLRHILGAVNGWLVAVMKLPPFIVTLGMWQIVLAANFLYSANETIRSQDIEAEAPLLQFFGQQVQVRRRHFTYGVIFMVLLVLSGLRAAQTAWGRHVYAVGDDPEAANSPASTSSAR